jgi:predicted  nucleic acid-binding Zn-ribbon protein
MASEDRVTDLQKRLTRIETRLVKYQEHNVQQFAGMHEALLQLADSIESLIDALPEQEDHHER